MTEETARDLEKRLITLLAHLDERCPQHYKEIERNAHDIDEAFSKIRNVESDRKDAVTELKAAMVEQSKDTQRQIHNIEKQLAKWSIGATLGTAVLVAIVTSIVKMILG